MKIHIVEIYNFFPESLLQYLMLDELKNKANLQFLKVSFIMLEK